MGVDFKFVLDKKTHSLTVLSWACSIVSLQLVHVLEEQLELGWCLDVFEVQSQEFHVFVVEAGPQLIGEAPDVVGVQGLGQCDTVEVVNIVELGMIYRLP